MIRPLLKNPLFVIFFTVFVDLLGFGILLPVIPFLLANPQSPYYLLSSTMTIRDGYILLGYLAATYPLVQFLSSPILGQLSDTFGRKKILLFSITGTFFSYLLFALAIVWRNIPLLFIARAIDGATGGNISVAQAVIADTTEPAHRTKNFGLIGAAFGIGFILGPYIGGKLSDPGVVPWFDATTPFLFAAILCAFNVLFIFLYLPETLRHKKETLSLKWTESIKNISRALSKRGRRELYITVFLFQSGIAFFTTFISVYLIKRFQLRQGSVGEFFAYAGIWIAFTQAIITRFLSTEKREVTILKISLLGSGVCILLLFVATKAWELVFFVPLFAIFIGLTQATITSLISASSDEYSQGESLGIGASLQAFAQSIPPILSGYIAAIAYPSAPIIVAACVIIASGIIFTLSYKQTNQAS